MHLKPIKSRFILCLHSCRQEVLRKKEIDYEESEVSMIAESPNKIYVDVNVECKKDGSLIPKAILWSDDKTYEIEKITDVRRAASLIAGATGVRYTIYIEGYESHLFYGDNHRWFVEGKTGKV